VKRSTRKKLVVTIAALAVAVGSVAAYAYWTTSGSGSGSGSVAASNGTITLHGTVTSALAPGGSSPVTLTADNAGSTDLQVGTVHLVSVTPDAGHSGCAVADFSMADVAETTVVTHGASGQALPNNGTLAYANSANNQDACKGASLTLALSSN
jgi:hypothetical protein